MQGKEIVESLRSLHDLSKAINSSLHPTEVADMICHKTAGLMQSDKVLLLLLDKEKSILSVHNHLGFEDDELPVLKFHDIRSFEHCLVHKGTVISMTEVLAGQEQGKIRQAMPFLFDMFFAPLEVKGEVSGLLGVSGEPHEFSIIELEIFCSIGSQAAVALENANLYQRLRGTFLHTAEALAEAVSSRDPYTGGHTRRVQAYALHMAQALNLPDNEKDTLRLAAILHDIGKIGINDAILRKGEALTDEEKQEMRKHPEIGAHILSFVDEMREVIPGVGHHHEWFDGSGYPDGLKGKDIPLIARIISIADAFDALTTDRPYRKSAEPVEACIMLEKYAGSHFDPELLEIFTTHQLAVG